MKVIYLLREKLNIILRFLAITFFSVGIIATFIGVTFRFLPFLPNITLTDELTRFLIIASVFFISGIGLREGTHISLTLLLEKMPKSVRSIVVVINNLILACFFLVLIIYGTEMALQNKSQISPLLQISMFLPYMVIPIGAAAMLLENIIKIIEEFTYFNRIKKEDNHLANFAKDKLMRGEKH